MSGFGGLDQHLRYYEFELDSLDAIQSNDYSVTTLNWPLFGIGGKRPLSNIAAIKILEVQIPFSYYVFNATNNTFLFNYNGAGNGVITIPVGNYTTGTLATALQVALRAVIGGTTMTVTFTNLTEKFQFVDTAFDFTMTFGSAGDRGTTNPRLWMGFPAGTTASTSKTLVAPNIASVSGPNYLYVNSLKMGQLTNLYLPRDSIGGGNAGPQMAKIPVNVVSGGVVYWQDPGTLTFNVLCRSPKVL